jgi:hypothetical protein
VAFVISFAWINPDPRPHAKARVLVREAVAAMVERRVPVVGQRGFRQVEATRYVGVSPTKFLEMVRDGRMPSGFFIDSCRIWDIVDLDRAFDDLKAADPSEVLHHAAAQWDAAVANIRA